jgi:predicted amidohydrolase
MKLRVATGQFPVNVDIEQNLGFIGRQIASAAEQEADAILFPETALSGYAGIDFDSFVGYEWNRLKRAVEQVLDWAQQHQLWVIVGSHHRLSGRRKPHNSLYVIDPSGRLVTRYDKRFCTVNDLDYYSPGTAAITVRMKGVRCGLLICHEWRYPELYRQYKKLKVDLILQSWYDGGLSTRQMQAEGNVFAQVIPATAQAHAACNHLWLCGTNTSKRQCCFGGFVIRPDGTFLDRLPRNRPGVMTCTIDTRIPLHDHAAHGRSKAIRGVDHLGPAIRDFRSSNRRCF